MCDRREFLKQAFFSLFGSLILIRPGFLPLDWAWAAIKRLLPKGTDLKTLVNENPAALDPRDLEIEPLGQFETMGLSDHEVDLQAWRLVGTGRVSAELRLTYDQVQALPSVERAVLLICPGFFANYGRWKGVSLAELGRRAGVKQGVNFVTVYGPEGPYEKTVRFPWKDMATEKVFLAWQVNGEKLPKKHGFPLRLVAEGVYGTDWIKYVYKVQFDKIDRA